MLKSLKKAKIENKTVLLRSDFDVPVGESENRNVGEIRVKDDFRILQSLETINHLRKQKAKTVIISHLGRPQGKDNKLSLAPVAHHLAGLLDLKVVEIDQDTKKLPHYPIPHFFFFTVDIDNPKLKEFIADLNPCDVAMLENIRFNAGEETGDEGFTKILSNLGEIYVNDAFGVSHRDHASITGIPKYLPHYPGLHLEQELRILETVVKNPKRPFILVIGGIKLSDKLEGLAGLIKKVDQVLVGGGLAALFFAARGFGIGKSIVEKGSMGKAKDLLRDYKSKIILPQDVVVAVSSTKLQTIEVVSPEKIPPSKAVLDIGPATIQKFSEHIKLAKTIVWSGPLGLFEVREFSHGSKAIGRLIASRSSGIALGLAGGGNTVEVLRAIGMENDMDFLSSGGSAMLQYLGGVGLPGIKILES